MAAGRTTKVGGGDPSAKLEEMLRRPGIASELFLPAELATWNDGRYQVVKSDAPGARSTAGGVRLHAFDPSGRSQGTESDCQQDVVRLVEMVRAFRKEPELANAVLSGGSTQAAQLGNRAGQRVKFGLHVPMDQKKFGDETSAARETHKQIVAAVGQAGFAVVQPSEQFDPKTGLEGLSHWASRLRLRRKRNYWPMILAALLLLGLLALLPWKCDGEEILNTSVKTDSLIMILDQSGSMVNTFPTVRSEAKRFLKARKSGFWWTYYIESIKYSNEARAALGELRKVDDENIARVEGFLEEAPSQGGTNLASALEIAAAEVARHGKPTTVVILTDGEDASIPMINANIDAWKSKFKGVEVHVNTVTPRLLGAGPGVDRMPQNDYERNLAQLSESLGGQFGMTPKGETKP